jgi:hypothetical protein
MDREREEEKKRLEEDKKKGVEMNEINFPSLASSFGGAGGPSTAWKQAGTDLARAWSEADEEQRIREEIRRQREEREQRSLEAALAFRRPYSYETEDRTVYEQDYDVDEDRSVPTGEDGWEQVDRHRKKKPSSGTMGWKPMTPPYPPETAQDSVWGGEEDTPEDSVW